MILAYPLPDRAKVTEISLVLRRSRDNQIVLACNCELSMAVD
jgi:hypothetical protein